MHRYFGILYHKCSSLYRQILFSYNNRKGERNLFFAILYNVNYKVELISYFHFVLSVLVDYFCAHQLLWHQLRSTRDKKTHGNAVFRKKIPPKIFSGFFSQITFFANFFMQIRIEHIEFSRLSNFEFEISTFRPKKMKKPDFC